MAYAENTRVSIAKTKDEIERLLMSFGASDFGYANTGGGTAAVIGFRYEGVAVKLDLPLPDPKSEEFTRTEVQKYVRDADTAYKLWETACRSQWRNLLLLLKAKFNAIEVGITDFEKEFLPYFVCYDGRTMSQHILPDLGRMLKEGPMTVLSLPAPEPKRIT